MKRFTMEEIKAAVIEESGGLHCEVVQSDPISLADFVVSHLDALPQPTEFSREVWALKAEDGDATAVGGMVALEGDIQVFPYGVTYPHTAEENNFTPVTQTIRKGHHA